jgi:Tol biopolymer transport system component
MSNRVGGPRLVPSAQPPSPSRLQSWKEIAGYLQRDERTVRRWERSEGLPVHRLQHGKSASVSADPAELDAWRADHTTGGPNRLNEPGTPSGLRWRGVFWLTAAVAAAAAVWIGLFFRPPAAEVATAVPLTTDPGVEMEPRLCPDGERIAYVWDGDAHDNFDIYVRRVAGGPPMRVTNNPAPEYSPAWSPDGASIAFLRQVDVAKAAVFVASALGGAERKLAEFPAGSWPRWDRPGPFLAWSRDGNWLVVAARDERDTVDQLLRVAVATGETRPLTVPGHGSRGDTGPAISPDGKTLAFSRRGSWSASDLCLLPLSDDLMPAGDVRRLNTGWAWNTGPAWTPNGRAVIFSTGMMDAPHLAMIAVSDAAQPKRLAGVGEYGVQPSLAKAADKRVRLVYTQHFESVNIWRQLLDTAAPATQLIASAHRSYEPDYSPDGKRIAFLSDRSGFAEIWVAGSDGRNPSQWTFLEQSSLGAPRWSPDSRRIAFTAPGRDESSIYLLEAPGVPPREVAGSYRCGYLAWSPDGRALYFSSNRGGSTQIWKVGPQGGEAVQVTTHGGRVPAISADGRYLYYLRLVSTSGENELFRVALGGGAEAHVLKSVEAYSLSPVGIAFKYYRPGARPEGPYLRFMRFATGKIEEFPNPAKPLRYGVAVSPDGRNLLYSQSDYAVTDLMLVDSLR